MQKAGLGGWWPDANPAFEYIFAPPVHRYVLPDASEVMYVWWGRSLYWSIIFRYRTPGCDQVSGAMIYGNHFVTDITRSPTQPLQVSSASAAGVARDRYHALGASSRVGIKCASGSSLFHGQL